MHLQRPISFQHLDDVWLDKLGQGSQSFIPAAQVVIEKDALISFGDPANYCIVERLELSEDEVLVIVSVYGVVHDSSSAELSIEARSSASSSLSRIIRMRGSLASGCVPRMHFEDNGDASSQEIGLVFECSSPASLNVSGICFSYAPGYTQVSLLGLLSASVGHERSGGSSSDQSFSPSPPKQPNALVADMQFCKSEGCSEFGKDDTTIYSGHGSNLRHHMPTSSAAYPSARSAADEARLSLPGATWQVTWSERFDSCCHSSDAGHLKTMTILEQRLHDVQSLCAHWKLGDGRACSALIQSQKDDVLSYQLFGELQLHSDPLPPRLLAMLIPLVQKLAQSDVEDHAVAAMRFALRVLVISWPPVAKALRHVATRKEQRDACEEVSARLASLFTMVKTMSRSVRLSRNSNGPLVPVCRKLKASLEAALVAVGHKIRGAS